MLKKGEGPIGLVLAPTRELCQQIATVASKFASHYKIKYDLKEKRFYLECYHCLEAGLNRNNGNKF